jgi:type I restriction enzyme S subunit
LASVNPLPPSRQALPDDADVSFLPMEAIGEDGSLRLDACRQVADVRAGYSYFADGDVAFAKVTPCFENGKGALMRGLAGGQGFGTTELTVLRPGPQLDARFLHYFLQSPRFRQPGAGAMTGAGGLKRVPEEFTRNTLVPLPALQVQRRVAVFLDRETARIDALIEKKTRFIELLREKRQALITQAVTKGLDPSVTQKDSGVGWLGKIPAHWRVVPVRHVARMESGHTPDRQNPEYWTDCEIPWISLSDSQTLRSVDVITETAKRINEKGLANSSARLLPAGTVVMTRDATVGLSAIAGTTLAVSQHLVAWIPGRSITSEYLLRVLRAMEPWLHLLSIGATIKTIGMDDIKSLEMPVPPLVEQQSIVEFLQQATARLEQLIERSERSIDLLKERRAALIAAAVTGQIDVRADLPEEQPEPT